MRMGGVDPVRARRHHAAGDDHVALPFEEEQPGILYAAVCVVDHFFTIAVADVYVIDLIIESRSKGGT